MRVLSIGLIALATVMWVNHASGCDESTIPEWDERIVEVLSFRSVDSSFRTIGTSFLVRLYDSPYRQLLISNRHVFRNTDSLWLRFNLILGTGAKVDTVPLSDTTYFPYGIIYPSDTGIDLAALPMPIYHTNWAVKCISKSYFSPISDIRRGSEIFYLGFPLGISLLDRSVPVYRKGEIALDRQLIKGTYLLDAKVLGGSSGSPVFSCEGKLVGVIASSLNYYFSDDKLPEIVSDSMQVECGILSSAGLGVMIPIETVIDFIDQIEPGWKNR